MNRSCSDFAHLLVVMVRDIVDEATRSFFVLAEALKPLGSLRISILKIWGDFGMAIEGLNSDR
jgi:hypothetical protein